ncbi:MAG TPA: spondin domain-containing protein [Pyrinomonadaceae bacterium]|nr:spondin domain-containing protein [Pyrinomonadaceae bacterium]
MLKQKFIIGLAVLTALVFGFQAEAFANKKSANFKVRIENVSNSEGLTTQGGAKYPFALSPGMFVVSKNKTNFFKVGEMAMNGLEEQAEDGNPEVLAKNFAGLNVGVFNMPVGADKPAPILPGSAYEFTFTAMEGMKLNLIAMYGQSNDLFYAPEKAFDLFKAGNPLTGDITDKLMLWDAGTEVNQAPGIGDQQAPRQKAANMGTTENGMVGMVKDGFSYPNTKDVLKVTITAE